MFYLPTKEECDYIVKNSKQFFKKIENFKNKDFHIYAYKQANIEEFEKFKAYELRGLTFNENRYLAIHKFFELNQAKGWMYEDIKDKKILKVTEKIDGSMLQPILIDNEIYFKTKLTFNSYQAKEAKKLLTKKQKEFIKECFNKNLIPIFEYISPKSQVVMNYDKEELFLIQIRNLNTGEYILDFEKNSPFKTPKIFNFKNIDEIIEYAKGSKDIEGFVVIFEDMQFLKIKSDEYLSKHKIIGKIQANEVIKALIEKNNVYEEILNKKSEKFETYNTIKTLFLKKYNSLKKEAKKAIKLSKKEFKQKYKNHPYYELFALCKNKGIENFDEWIKKHTARLKGANKFLEN